eukprot:364362-Chlamydomonas_euryale.AAC.32
MLRFHVQRQAKLTLNIHGGMPSVHAGNSRVGKMRGPSLASGMQKLTVSPNWTEKRAPSHTSSAQTGVHSFKRKMRTGTKNTSHRVACSMVVRSFETQTRKRKHITHSGAQHGARWHLRVYQTQTEPHTTSARDKKPSRQLRRTQRHAMIPKDFRTWDGCERLQDMGRTWDGCERLETHATFVCARLKAHATVASRQLASVHPLISSRISDRSVLQHGSRASHASDVRSSPHITSPPGMLSPDVMLVTTKLRVRRGSGGGGYGKVICD